jgi:hypothetical protein
MPPKSNQLKAGMMQTLPEDNEQASGASGVLFGGCTWQKELRDEPDFSVALRPHIF